MSMIDDLIKSLHKPKNIGGLIAFVIIIIIMGAVFDHAAGTTDVVPIGGHGGNQFSLKFNETSESFTTITGHTNEDETTHEDISINHTNITKIVFTLTWSDDLPPEDEFRLTITPPSDSNLTPSNSEFSTSEEIQLELIVNSMPKDTRVKANSEDEAAGYNTTYSGSGSWGADVEAGDCQPDAYLPLAPDPDDGNDWTLEITIYYYIGIIEEAEDVTYG